MLLSFAPLWAALGAANVLLGVTIALRPDGSRDAGWLWIWTRNWLQGSNPYRWPIPADYPPWALVSLSPIGAMPGAAAAAVWAAAGVCLALAVAWIGPKAIAADSTPPRRAAGLFLSWAAVRYGLGNGQFALLAVACGLAAVWLARRGSRWSGLFLGAALIKPHVGIAFLAWAIAAGKWRAISGAVAAIGAGTLVFSARLHESPLAGLIQYARQIAIEFQHPDQLRGSVEIGPLLAAIVGDASAAAYLNATLAAASLAAIIWMLSRHPYEARERLALPLFCMWTLASTFHNAYDLVLLWPVWLSIRDRQLRGPESAPYVLLLVQAAMVAGIPALWWKLYGSGAGLHFDRVLVVGLLVYLIATSRAEAERSGRPALGQVHGRKLVQPSARHSSQVMLP
jgi:hypothetical protein